MPNAHVLQRLTGLQTILMDGNQGSKGLSTATIGQERSGFIDELLAKVLPPIYRFGYGDATDVSGARSSPLDIVVEYPFTPSIPVVGSGEARLYIAESIAAVIEVKSDLAGQWNDVVKTAGTLAPLQRTFIPGAAEGPVPEPRIPLFAVGYTGWDSMAGLQSNLNACPNIDGALVIDAGFYASKSGAFATGPAALWALIVDLHRMANALQNAAINPMAYTA